MSQRGFCNNASIARDGTIYFTDSSSRFPLSAWRRDILEHRPNGRLLAYRDGTYWIAMPSPRLPIVESLLPHPLLRKLADLLPQWMQPRPSATAWSLWSTRRAGFSGHCTDRRAPSP